ncbi:MAG: hypothetical protein ACREHV_16620 [Rhizomicrobium sp.]
MPFIAQGGYQRAFAVHRLTYGTFASVPHKYLYVETPKAACTSMKQFVAKLEGVTVDLQRAPSQKESKRSSIPTAVGA